MKEHEKFYSAISKINLNDEKAVNCALRNAGLYSKSQMFPILSLQFDLTSNCNMFCKHCYNNSGICNNVPDAMTPEKWVNFVNYIVEHGGVFECILTGGESFLIGDTLFKIMDILHEDGTIFLLITNGSFMTESKAKWLSKYHYHWLQISIDSVSAEYHDSFRQLKGSWQKAVEAASMVSKNAIPLKIAHCVTPYNLHEVDDMCALAYSLGATSILAGEICFSGRATQNQDLFLSNEQKHILKQKIEENRERYKGRMRVKSSNSVSEGLKRHLKFPRSSIVIRPNGDIRLDDMLPFVVGNVLTEDFEKILSTRIEECWKNPKVIKFISDFDENDKNYSIINYIDDDICI